MPTIDELLAEAQAARRAGELPRAEELLKQVVRADAVSFEARYQLGALYHQLRRPEDAIAAFAAALRVKGDDAQAHNHLGAVLAEQGRLDDAIASFRRAAQLDPPAPGAVANLQRALSAQAVAEGFPLAEQGRFDQAAECFNRALELNPDNVDAQNNLGYLLLTQGKPREATAYFHRAVELAPDYLPPYINLGSSQERLGRAADALPWLRRAVELAPDSAETHNNLGVALYSLGELDEAMDRFARALELAPDHPRARLNRALGLLLRGDFANGWREFECRAARFAPTAGPLPPRWSGEPLEGRTILVRGEEGIGDTIQFVRYARSLADRGASVTLECPGVLVRLLATCPGVDRVVATGEPLPRCDYHVPMLSLPGILGTSLDSIPAGIPYLEPDPELVEQWAAQWATHDQFRVGIAWQGNPSHRADAYRSIRLSWFERLADVPGVGLYSLQMGPGREQLSEWPGRRPIRDLADQLGDFYNTAAAVRNLDLVVTCDSAPAHLAGALGVPVWVALAVTPDWRWLLRRSDNPWYRTARLFRQQRAGAWEEVFHRIADALKNHVAGNRRASKS